MPRSISAAIALLAVSLAAAPLAGPEDVHDQAAVVAAQLGTIARHLQLHPEMALDLTEVSDEHCLNTWKAGGEQMVHLAIDPSATQEDVVEFVKADSFTGVDVDVASLPRMPSSAPWSQASGTTCPRANLSRTTARPSRSPCCFGRATCSSAVPPARPAGNRRRDARAP